MTKADIVDAIGEKTDYTKKQADEIVKLVFETLKSTLERGESLKISGFGSFLVRQKADRRGRNPQTGEAIILEARRIVTFKPSEVLKASLNGQK